MDPWADAQEEADLIIDRTSQNGAHVKLADLRVIGIDAASRDPSCHQSSVIGARWRIATNTGIVTLSNDGTVCGPTTHLH